MLLIGLLEFICLIGISVTLIGFLIQLIRKKPNKKNWGITLIAFCVILIVCVILTSDSPTKESDDNQTVQVTEQKQDDGKKDEQAPSEEETPKEDSTTEDQSESDTTDEVKEKTAAEKFAEENNISLQLAESFETVLQGMELTDKSRVGVFHYELSNIYNWKQVDDWAEGQRYSIWADMEHILYVYVKDDTVVGIRDGNGNVLYLAE